MSTPTPDAYIASIRKAVSSGLPDDFIGTIKNVVFRTDPGYQDGQYLACFFDVVDIDDDDIEDMEDRRHTIGAANADAKYAWETEDDGKSVVRDDGKPPAINNNTGYGKILDELLGQQSFIDALIARNAQGISPTPNQAAFLEGARGHWTQVSETIPARPAGNGYPAQPERTFTSLVMDEFVEFVGDKKAKPAKKAAAKKAAPAAAPAAAAPVAPKATPKAAPAPAPEPEPEPEVAEVVAGGDVDQDTINAIYAIALDELGGEASYDTFLERCYSEIPAVADDENAQALVDDDSDGSLWGQAIAAIEAAGG